MAAIATQRRFGRVLRYTFGSLICLVAGVNVLIGTAWFVSLGVAVPGLVIILGKRRIFRLGVTRTSEEIVCRYLPWYEGNAYVLNLAIPLLGLAMIAAGFAPGYPAWLRFGGSFLVGLTAFGVFASFRMWRRCFLRITPSALSVRLAAPEDSPIEIARECVQSIVPKIVPNGVSGSSLQVEITYRPAESSDDATQTVLLGLQLTVPPFNLLSALTAWKESTNDGPSELLDRVEQALRDRSTAGV